ncbi:MFS transporter [Vibrio sp. 10N.237.312.B06]|uniref:MFS transporter n=1 Tax=Vibrio sp. 10N.237.312.B06 TaxID=3229974 RepID=UPI00355426B4
MNFLKIPLEKKVILFASLIQFLHSLEFMMMVPLSSDLVVEMNINKSYTGYITGVYIFSSSLSSLLLSGVLDKFDRKKVIFGSLLGMSIMTLITTMSWDFDSLVLFRAFSGIFAGPLISVSMSIVLDYVSMQRRTFAFSIVTSMLSISSIVGVPLALVMSNYSDWRLPLYSLAFFGLIISLFFNISLPSMKDHIRKYNKLDIYKFGVIGNAVFLKSFVLTGLTVFSTFLIVPHIPVYIQFNLGLERGSLSAYYFIAGILSFIVMGVCGKIAEKINESFVILFCSMVIIFIIFRAFVFVSDEPFIMGLFAGFMAFSMTRTVTSVLFSSKHTKPCERAKYMSIQNASQGLFIGLASLISSSVLFVENDKLQNMEIISMLAIFVSAVVPLLAVSIQRYYSRNKNPNYSIVNE